MTDIEFTAYLLFNEYRAALDERRLHAPHYIKDSLWLCAAGTQKRFLETAEACLDLGLNPANYIKTVFQTLSKNSRYITVKDIFTAKKAVEISRLKDKLKQSASADWLYMCADVQQRIARTIPAHYLDLADFLCDPLQPFTAYFRVLYPEEGIYKLLFDAYNELAYSELAHDRSLRAYLRTVRADNLLKFEELTRPFSDAILEGEHN